MYRKLSWIFIIVTTLIMAGCGPLYETSYSFAPPSTSQGKMCVLQCQQSKTLCQRLCTSDNSNCKLRARSDAQFQYEQYVSAQTAARQPVTKTLNDFYNPFQCLPKSCHCAADYRSCFQLCGGDVTEQRTCVANCGKQQNL